jgi:hypothetical protein
VDVEQSEAPASSPNRQARVESKEGNGGGGGSAWACHAAEGERRGRGVSSKTTGPEWLRAARSKRQRALAAEAGWRTGEGGVARLTDGAGRQRGPVSAAR